MFDGSYCGSPPNPGDLAGRWNFDPFLLVLLAGVLILSVGLAREGRSAGLAAAGTLFIIFVSPLCALSVALFSARAAHHLLLVGIAAPLLAVAFARPVWIGPGAALAIFTTMLWGWHVPALYDAAIANRGVYWAMQATLLGTGWLFWRAVFAASAPIAGAAIAGGAAQMGLLGSILTFAPVPLYTSHLTTTAAFGLAPLADQQAAGLLMWVVGLVPFAVAAVWAGRTGWRGLAASPPA